MEDIFIDESGTHKHTGHATTAVVSVMTKNFDKFEHDLLKIEEDLRIQSFHWAEERWFMRNKFLSHIIKLDFTFKVAIFENPVKPEAMTEFVFKSLLAGEDINTIYIDGKKPKWYEQRLKKVLRDRGTSVKRLKTVRRNARSGLQLADALAGLVRYHYDNPDEPDAEKWFKKLKKEKKLLAQILVETEVVEKLLKQ